MSVQKLSISLPQQQYEVVTDYQITPHFRTRSEVIREALYLLQQTQLESCYREASKEVDDAFENPDLDGLKENQAW